MDKIAIFALYLLKDMVCVLSLLCLVIGLLVGFLYGKGKAGKDYKAHTQELLDARQKAYDDMLATQQSKFDETIACVRT